jgi:hypothetical protein
MMIIQVTCPLLRSFRLYHLVDSWLSKYAMQPWTTGVKTETSQDCIRHNVYGGCSGELSRDVPFADLCSLTIHCEKGDDQVNSHYKRAG